MRGNFVLSSFTFFFLSPKNDIYQFIIFITSKPFGSSPG